MSLRYAHIVPILATLPVVALAQQSAQPALTQLVTVGSQVRVGSSAIQGRARGRIASLDDRSMSLLVDDGAVVNIPVPSITSLQLQIGKRRHPLHGFLIGAAVGIVIGATEPVNPNNCNPDYSDSWCSRGEAVGIIGSLYGGLGALVGWLVATDRWATVSVTRITPEARPAQKGVRLAATVHF